VLTKEQSECYLSSWTEQWENSCKCNSQTQLLTKKQRLVEIVRQRSQNLKESIKQDAPRCSECNAKMKCLRTLEHVFVGCQKIKIQTVMKTGCSKDEIYQRGELCIFLDQNYVEALSIGDVVDMCVYFSAEPCISRIAGREISLALGRSAFLVTCYPPAKRSSVSNTFFTSIANLSCEYIHCADPRNQ
jgi:hypothetical protein